MEGLGTTSLAVIYAALVVSCMFVPTLMIKKLTVKWTMVVSIFCYSTYIAAQFYPQFYTLVPGAIILGLGAAPMWSAKCTYLTQVGNIYAELTNQAVEPIIVKFFGIFFLFFQSSSIWGNLISSAGKILRISPEYFFKKLLQEGWCFDSFEIAQKQTSVCLFVSRVRLWYACCLTNRIHI